MIRQFIFSLYVLCCASLHGELHEYFKKAENKGTCHSLGNIDFIYLINLDQRPQKFASCTKQLHPYGIFPYRFSAVNGWEIPLEVLNSIGVKFMPWMSHGIWGTCYFPEDQGQPHHEEMQQYGRNYYCHCMSRGAIGIVLSHLSILQDAYDSGYETIWVMEDDIEVIQDPRMLPDVIEMLDKQVGKKGWDILFTDQDTKSQRGEYVICLSYARRPNFHPENPSRFAIRKEISTTFRTVGARYGAYSMILRRSGIKKILDHFKTYNIFLPYDMEFYLPADMRMFTVLNDIVSTQSKALSDNGSPGYAQGSLTD